MTQADKLVRLTQQLVGDISRLPGVVLDSGGEAQLVQLLTDAFEAVGHVALQDSFTPADPEYYNHYQAATDEQNDGRECCLVNCAISYPHNHKASPPGNA